MEQKYGLRTSVNRDMVQSERTQHCVAAMAQYRVNPGHECRPFRQQVRCDWMEWHWSPINTEANHRSLALGSDIPTEEGTTRVEPILEKNQNIWLQRQLRLDSPSTIWRFCKIIFSILTATDTPESHMVVYFFF